MHENLCQEAHLPSTYPSRRLQPVFKEFFVSYDGTIRRLSHFSDRCFHSLKAVAGRGALGGVPFSLGVFRRDELRVVAHSQDAVYTIKIERERMRHKNGKVNEQDVKKNTNDERRRTPNHFPEQQLLVARRQKRRKKKFR